MQARILEPHDPQMAAVMLAECSAAGMTVVPRGCGSKLSWGNPPHADTYLSTRRLSEPIQHYPGDLVATVPAGAILSDVNAVLGRQRQWLPLDPAGSSQATIGGIVATNDSGPRRQQYGATRDLIIGIDIVLADGRQAKAGGRVVKNVAGYDLGRLMCGSFGTLALITSATFKLAPVAPASRTVVVDARDPGQLTKVALAIAAAPLSPSAIELQAPGYRLLIRFETTEAAALRQAQRTLAIFDAAGLTGTILDHEREADLWRRHEHEVWGAPGVIIVKVAVLPTEVPAVLLELRQLASRLEIGYAAVGRAALGILAVRLDGSGPALVATIAALRRAAGSRGGSVVVLRAPTDGVVGVEAWDEVGEAAAVMRAVKSRFDPRNTLSPGRGPAGL